jgi:hypothetical protein
MSRGSVPNPLSLQIGKVLSIQDIGPGRGPPQSPGFDTRSLSGRRLGFPPKSSAYEQEDSSRSDEERDFHEDSEIEGLPKCEERVVEGDDEFNDTAPDDQTGDA